MPAALLACHSNISPPRHRCAATDNKTLFAFASYNAGPGRIRSLRAEAAKRGLDPNKWFYNVALVVAERIGQETITYVGNIYKYYIAYTLFAEQEEEKRQAREALERGKPR